MTYQEEILEAYNWYTRHGWRRDEYSKKAILQPERVLDQITRWRLQYKSILDKAVKE